MSNRPIEDHAEKYLANIVRSEPDPKPRPMIQQSGLKREIRRVQQQRDQ